MTMTKETTGTGNTRNQFQIGATTTAFTNVLEVGYTGTMSTQGYAEIDARRGTSAEDDVFITLRHATGTISHLHASAVTPSLGPRLRVQGTAAGFLVPGLDPQEAALRGGGRPDAVARWGEPAEWERGRLLAVPDPLDGLGQRHVGHVEGTREDTGQRGPTYIHDSIVAPAAERTLHPARPVRRSQAKGRPSCRSRPISVRRPARAGRAIGMPGLDG